MPNIRVLLIEDNSEHADLIRSHLGRKHGANVQIHWVDRLSKGLEHLSKGGVDVVLLDLGLPDSSIDSTLGAILSKAPQVPVVVLSALEDEDFGLRAVHEGAQDYICKGWMDGEVLFRSLRYAIERKIIEEELRRVNNAKDEFLATLSHELRTPIGVIQGFAEILAQESPSHEEKKIAIEAILRNAKLQVSLINDMLDMSRIITGKFTLENKVQNLIPIIENAVESVSLAAQSKGVKLMTDFDSSAGTILGDQVRIHQIMWNLLSNAIKFTPSGGKILVRLRRRNSHAEIDVEDNGEGIDPDFLPFVFDRFRQQDGSKKRRFGGLGLGLAIVRYLVELHGGKTFAKSEGSGRGSTFTVSFPLLATNVKTTESKVKSKAAKDKIPSTAAHNGRLSGLRILVIDDSTDSLSMVSLILRRYGADVLTAQSAAEGYDVLKENNPNLILCDIGMPIEDGYSFLQRVRLAENSLGKEPIPAAALTAYTSKEEIAQAMNSGFQAHLAKPIEERVLIDTVAGLARN